jgi:hypothetical protein
MAVAFKKGQNTPDAWTSSVGIDKSLAMLSRLGKSLQGSRVGSNRPALQPGTRYACVPAGCAQTNACLITIITVALLCGWKLNNFETIVRTLAKFNLLGCNFRMAQKKSSQLKHS